MTGRKSLVAATLSFALVAADLVLLPDSVAGAAPVVHTVVIDKMKFGAVPAGVRSGDTIIWVNRDMFRHTATARDISFSVDLPPKSSRRTVIKRSGTIVFYCVYHPGMTGTLAVAK